MKRWEYSMYIVSELCAYWVYGQEEVLLDHNGDAKETLKHLNSYGAEGWDVISVTLDAGSVIYTLKRKLNQDS